LGQRYQPKFQESGQTREIDAMISVIGIWGELLPAKEQVPFLGFPRRGSGPPDIGPGCCVVDVASDQFLKSIRSWCSLKTRPAATFPRGGNVQDMGFSFGDSPRTSRVPILRLPRSPRPHPAVMQIADTVCAMFLKRNKVINTRPTLPSPRSRTLAQAAALPVPLSGPPPPPLSGQPAEDWASWVVVLGGVCKSDGGSIPPRPSAPPRSLLPFPPRPTSRGPTWRIAR
jgi:hypothetical protein